MTGPPAELAARVAITSVPIISRSVLILSSWHTQDLYHRPQIDLPPFDFGQPKQ